MLKALHPGLTIGTLEYRRKLQGMSNIRKLGERLHTLVEVFGYRVIGLLLLPADDMAVDPGFTVSDNL
jgi:hypothetical protein